MSYILTFETLNTEHYHRFDLWWFITSPSKQNALLLKRAAYVEDIKIKLLLWKSRLTEYTILGFRQFIYPVVFDRVQYRSKTHIFEGTRYGIRTTCGVVIVMTLHIQESKDYMNHQNQHATTGCTIKIMII